MTMGTPWVPPTPAYLTTAGVEATNDPARPAVYSVTAQPITGPDGAPALGASVTFPGLAQVRRITVSSTSRCLCRIYVGTPGVSTLTSATTAGDLDENDCGANPITVPEGAPLWIVWDRTDGAAGARVEAAI